MPSRLRRWSCALLLAFLVGIPGPATAQPSKGSTGSESGARPVIEGGVDAVSENLVVTSIPARRLGESTIAEGEVVDVSLGTHVLRARFMPAAQVRDLMADRAALEATDADALCFGMPDGRLAIVGTGGALEDLVTGQPGVRVLVVKP